MVQVFLKLFNMSVSAGWVILAVLLLRLLLKKAPKNFRLALWAVAAFRLICPFTIESVLSLIPSAETVPAEAFWVQTPQVQTGVTVLNSSINPILETTMATEEFSSAPPMFLLFYFFSYLWLIGLAVLALYGIISYLRLRRNVAASVPLRENIRICDSIPTPFILGYLKPKIYLPSHLPPEQWEPVIAHEQAHLKRRDHWIKLLGFVLLCVYWFQPLVWVAYILLCRDIELACDERVIRDMDPAQKKDYSEALLACGIRKHTLSASPLAFGEVGVKTRIKAVLDYKKPRFWIVMAAVIVCAVTAVCFLTDPVSLNADDDQWGNYDTVNTDIDGDRVNSAETTVPDTQSSMDPSQETPGNPDDASLRAIADLAVMDKFHLSDLDSYEVTVSRHATNGTVSVEYRLYILGYYTYESYTVYFTAEGTIRTISGDYGQYARYLPYATEEACAQAKAKLDRLLEPYGERSGYYLSIDSEGYLCLSTEIIHYLDTPRTSEDGTVIQGCGYDHEHLFFHERICHYT